MILRTKLAWTPCKGVPVYLIAKLRKMCNFQLLKTVVKIGRCPKIYMIFQTWGCLLAWGKGHMCYLLQVLAKAITRLPSQKRAGKINKIMSHFLVSSTLPFIFFWLLASLCRMTWTFQFIIIYMIYSQKLSKKLLQGGTKSIDFCKSLIDLQNLYSARYFTSLRFNAEARR